MTDDAKIIEDVAERLRFFFSDANIRGDKFMRRELENKESGGEGFISIDILLRFNSIKKHTTDAKIVAEAAKHESLSDRIKLNADETAVGRVVPFDKEKMLDNVKLSLRVESLPVKEEEGGEKKYAVTVDELKELFSEYGSVTLVRLQRQRPYYKKDDEDKDLEKYSPQSPVPTGAAFVEFETEEQLKKAEADLCGDGEKEPAKTLEVGGNKLKIQTMRKWIDEKERKKADRKGGTSPMKRDRDNAKDGDDDKGEAEYEEFKLDWKKGRVISLKGLSDECDREAICEAVAKFLGADPKSRALGVYADFSRGQTEGAIRFHNDKVGEIEGDKIPEKVSEIAAKLSDGSIEVAGAKVGSAALLEGEEEEKYYKNFIDFKNKQRKQKAESRCGRKRPRRD